MKKILCLILCLTMLLGCTSALADEAAAGRGCGSRRHDDHG